MGQRLERRADDGRKRKSDVRRFDAATPARTAEPRRRSRARRSRSTRAGAWGPVPRCPQLFSRVLTNTSVAWSSSTSSTCSLCSLEGLVSAETVDALFVFTHSSAGPPARGAPRPEPRPRAPSSPPDGHRASRRENAADPRGRTRRRSSFPTGSRGAFAAIATVDAERVRLMFERSLRVATHAPSESLRRACAWTRSASLCVSAVCLRAVPTACRAPMLWRGGRTPSPTAGGAAERWTRLDAKILTEDFRLLLRQHVLRREKRARDSRTTRRFRRIAESG